MLCQPQAPHFWKFLGIPGQELGDCPLLSCSTCHLPAAQGGLYLSVCAPSCRAQLKPVYPRAELLYFLPLEARGGFQQKPKVGFLLDLAAEVWDCVVSIPGAALPLLPDQMQTGAVGGQPISNCMNPSEGKRQNPQISK